MSEKNLLNLTLTGLLLAVFSIACVGSGTKQTTSSPAGTPSPAASQGQTAGDDAAKEKDDENEKLKEKVAELEKKVDGQKQPTTTPTVKPVAPPVQTSGTTAQVNSPGDGFLALRSEPNSSYGYRILQIPHGAYVRVIDCQDYTERVGGRSGRWCRVSYAGYSGWAFDGWLVY